MVDDVNTFHDEVKYFVTPQRHQPVLGVEAPAIPIKTVLEKPQIPTEHYYLHPKKYAK